MIGKICGLKKYVTELPPEPKYRTMTAIIDLTNSDPESCITYADDAVGMTPKSNEWDQFFGHYPVLFKEGQEVERLNPNNFAQFEDGTDADITSGDAGDVMIAFPRRGLKIETSEDGNTVTVSMTDNPNDENFKYYAHTRGIVAKDIFYKGAYQAYLTDNGLMTSLSGKSIMIRDLYTLRIWTKNCGSGYDISGFYQLTYNQAMFILKYKNLDSQTALGKGLVTDDSNILNSRVFKTGETNTKGMDYGESKGYEKMKIFGMEDIWGYENEWIEGIICNTSRQILTATDNFNDNGTGYINQGTGATSDLSGYMSKPQGTSETGFIPKEVDSSSTTYFCDSTNLWRGNTVPISGGRIRDNNSAGIFNLSLACDSTETTWCREINVFIIGRRK